MAMFRGGNQITRRFRGTQEIARSYREGRLIWEKPLGGLLFLDKPVAGNSGFTIDDVSRHRIRLTIPPASPRKYIVWDLGFNSNGKTFAFDISANAETYVRTGDTLDLSGSNITGIGGSRTLPPGGGKASISTKMSVHRPYFGVVLAANVSGNVTLSNFRVT